MIIITTAIGITITAAIKPFDSFSWVKCQRYWQSAVLEKQLTSSPIPWIIPSVVELTTLLSTQELGDPVQFLYKNSQ